MSAQCAPVLDSRLKPLFHYTRSIPGTAGKSSIPTHSNALPVAIRKRPGCFHNRAFSQVDSGITSAAFAVAAGKAGSTAVHHDHSLGVALAAHGGVGRVVAACVVVGGLVLAGFKLRTLLGEDALGGFAQLVTFQKADGFQVFLDHGSDFGHQ